MTHLRYFSVASRIRVIWLALLPILLAILMITGFAGLARQAGLAASVDELAAIQPLAQGSSLVVGISQEPLGLDPARAGYDIPSFLLAAQVYDTLTAYQPGTSQVIPGLAITWTLSSDQLTWAFTLRPGIKFHDGSDLDAQAVLYNFERWWDPAHPQHSGDFEMFAGLFGGYKGEPDSLITGLSANGDQFNIQLAHPYSPLPSILALPAFSIASPAAIQAGTLMNTPVGSGPFTFVDWQPGSQIDLAANPSYWNGVPLITDLSFLAITDTQQMLSALDAGQIQAIEDLPQQEAISATISGDNRLIWRHSTSIGYLGINRAKLMLDELLVRQAIAHAIPKEMLIESHYLPGTQPADQFLPPDIWGRDPDITDYSYDPALARALLVQAGYSQGITITLALRDVFRGYLPDPVGTAYAIQADLESANIHTSVEVYDSQTFINKVYAGELDLFLLGWFSDYAHPANFFDYHFCGAGQLSFGPRDQVLCDELASAYATPDLDSQEIIYQSISQRVYETLPEVPLVYGRSALVLSTDVDGIVLSPEYITRYKDAYFSGAVQGIISPEAGGSLVYTGTQTTTTTVQVPAGAVSEAVTLRFTPGEAATPPQGYSSGHHTFDLDAYLEGDLLDGFTFGQPVTITIQYSDDDVIGLDESSLALFYRDEIGWHDAAQSCDPPSVYTRDLDENRISIAICHLSHFALFGPTRPRVYLPIISNKTEILVH